MIKPKEADKLANTTVQDYVNACNCDTPQDVANVLMKLASMCGLGMCGVVGQEEAISRMQGTADYIAKPENKSWNKETVQ